MFTFMELMNHGDDSRDPLFPIDRAYERWHHKKVSGEIKTPSL